MHTLYDHFFILYISLLHFHPRLIDRFKFAMGTISSLTENAAYTWKYLYLTLLVVLSGLLDILTADSDCNKRMGME